MSEIFETYLGELKEILIKYNEILIRLQKGEFDNNTINSIFRAVHTIKGNSGGMEFYNIEKVMHQMEDILQEIRDGKRKFNEAIVNQLFACHDFLEDAVEVIEQKKSDKNIDISVMLSNIEVLKLIDTTKVTKASAKSNCKNNKHEKKLRINVSDPELISVMVENCKHGYKVYRLTVKLSQECQMKNVKVWMIFEKVDAYSTFIFSNPERPEENEFKNSSYQFEGDSIEIYILEDKDIESLQDEISSLSDIVSVNVENFEVNWLESEKERILAEKRVLSLINELESKFSDIEKNEINLISIKNIENSLLNIVNFAEETLDDYLIKTSKDIIELIRCFSNNLSQVEVKDIKAIAFLINSVKKAIEDSSHLCNANFCKEISKVLDATRHKFMDEKSSIRKSRIENSVVNNLEDRDVFQKFQDEVTSEKIGKSIVIEEKDSIQNLMKQNKEQQTNKEIIKENSFIRIPINKVDSLMDMLGELLILNSQMEQKVSEIENENLELNNVISRSSKLIRGIQSLSMSLRMVEIKPTLHRLTRVARDTAQELNKKITIDIEGEDTEIDRSAVEKLFDPLMHLVRNAVSHGIESEIDRENLGKNPEGKIILRVFSKRGKVYIEVEDDGKGINIDEVYQKAKQQGLIIEGKDYTQEEIIRFIFQPGFSTQKVINNISGRGVGMNVVEAEINKMGGKVEIINKEGVGAIFSIRIPVNLAVVNGTIVEVSNGRYIIPTLFIKEFFIPQSEDWIKIQGKNKAIKVRDSIVPLVTEKEIFNTGGNEVSLEGKNVIILELEHKYIAFVVDKIISRQEIVSKPLDKEFSTLGFATGASILGDGKVSIILDVEAIFKMKHN